MTRLFYLCVVIVLSGCVSDISQNPRGRTDYIVGAVYRVKRPLVLRKKALYDPSIYSGVLVPAGTLLRVSRLELEHMRESFGSVLWVRAHIINGGSMDGEVNLSYVSQGHHGPPWALNVNTNNLEIVSTP